MPTQLGCVTKMEISLPLYAQGPQRCESLSLKKQETSEESITIFFLAYKTLDNRCKSDKKGL